MAMQTLTAVFKPRDDAIAAASELRRRGLSKTVTLSFKAGTLGSTTPEARSFRAWLEALFGRSADWAAYSDAIGRGETILIAIVADAGLYGAVGVLDHHLPTRVDRCRPLWREIHDHEALPTDEAPIRRASEPNALLRPRRPPDQATLTRMAQDLSTMPADIEDCLSRDPSGSRNVSAGMNVLGSDGRRIGIVDTVGRDAFLMTVDGLMGARHSLAKEHVGDVDTSVTLKLSRAETLRWLTPVD